MTAKATPQRFSRWFTAWPSTHVNAGRTVEVMPVSEHEQLREAAQAVVGEWNSPHHLRAERDEAVEPLIATLGAALAPTNREET